MKNVSLRGYSKYFLLAVLFILLVLTFFLLRDLFISIIGAIILAYFFHPVYKKLNQWIKIKTLSSLMVVTGLVAIIVVPLFFIIKILIIESTQVYNYLASLDVILNPTLNKFVQDGFLFITELASNFILSIPNRVISLFIVFFVLYYLLKDGEELIDLIKRRLPIEAKEKTLLFNDLKTVTSGVGYGIILTGVLEGLIIAVAFYFLDISSPILWGFVVTILAILPAVGPIIIWLPAMIMKFLVGENWSAIGILIVGLIVTVYFETILKSKLIGDKTKVHPVIIILGVVGGLKFLGIVGVVVGPLVLTTLITLFNSLWKNEIKN